MPLAPAESHGYNGAAMADENKKRILVADDDPDLLDLLKMDLGFQGYEVLAAANGKDALQLATSEKLDLILLDVMMPYIDGYHVAYEVTNKLGTKAPCICIMTSRDTSREKGIAMMSGATEVIQKPFEMAALHDKITELLAKTSAK
jgi:DNA-binding response OmpR family regulator